MRLIVGVAVAILMALTHPARATPPQAVSVTDMLFAANDTHIFLLRSLRDNMGSYTVMQTDVVLVARNRATNADDDVWPVARSFEHSPFEDWGDQSRGKTSALDGAVNPFDVAASQGAWLILSQESRPAAVQGITVSQDSLMLTLVEDGENGQHRLAFAELGARLTESLQRTRDTLPPYFAEAGIDVLQGVTFDPEADCTFAGFLRMVDANTRPSWLAEVTCENEWSMAPFSTFVVVPSEK